MVGFHHGHSHSEDKIDQMMEENMSELHSNIKVAIEREGLERYTK